MDKKLKVIRERADNWTYITREGVKVRRRITNKRVRRALKVVSGGSAKAISIDTLDKFGI
ncbi:MAG TPA: hypothetical protein V6C76_16805 [Drouetiella sp.]